MLTKIAECYLSDWAENLGGFLGLVAFCLLCFGKYTTVTLPEVLNLSSRLVPLIP